MKYHLTDLDELLQKIINSEAKEYFFEAVSAYRVGAYRLSVISVWIAVCIDITEKIRELSSSGDGDAKAIEDKISAISLDKPADMLNFEREILNIACEKLELIGPVEKIHLERLKEDRNICAHPNFFKEKNQFDIFAETALSYLVQAANYLLIQPPVKSRAFVTQIFHLIQEPSFPENEDSAYKILSSKSNLGSARSSGIRNLTIIIFKRIFKDKDTISQSTFDKYISALTAIERLYPFIFSETVKSKFNDFFGSASDLFIKRVIRYLSKRSNEWSLLDEGVKLRIQSIISNSNPEEFKKYKLIRLAEKNQLLRESIIIKINEFTQSEQIAIIKSDTSLLLKENIINIFSNAKSYAAAYDYASSLITPISDRLGSEDIRNIIEAALGNTGKYGHNQILLAGGIEDFFISLYQFSMEKYPACLEHWKFFLENLKSRDINYESLKLKMVEDGVAIESTEEKNTAKEIHEAV